MVKFTFGIQRFPAQPEIWPRLKREIPLFRFCLPQTLLSDIFLNLWQLQLEKKKKKIQSKSKNTELAAGIMMQIRNRSKCAISHRAILSSSKGDINHVSCHIILHSWLLYTVIDLPPKKKAGRETQFFFPLFVVNSWQRPVIKLAIARLSSCSLFVSGTSKRPIVQGS